MQPPPRVFAPTAAIIVLRKLFMSNRIIFKNKSIKLNFNYIILIMCYIIRKYIELCLKCLKPETRNPSNPSLMHVPPQNEAGTAPPDI